MKWTAILALALLLGGCATRSIPNLEDVPPTAQASTAPGTVADSGRTVEQTTKQPSEKTPDVTGPVIQSGQVVQPPSEQQAGPAPTVTAEAVDSGRGVKLTAQQRSDIERGVRHGLAGSDPAEFGPMAATVSRVTSKSYIVCGWVKGGDSAGGYRPFLAMYVPYMRIALLVAISGKQPEAVIRGRCIDEGVPLPS